LPGSFWARLELLPFIRMSLGIGSVRKGLPWSLAGGASLLFMY